MYAFSLFYCLLMYQIRQKLTSAFISTSRPQLLIHPTTTLTSNRNMSASGSYNVVHDPAGQQFYLDIEGER